jgi:competence protein ComGF
MYTVIKELQYKNMNGYGKVFVIYKVI